MNSNRITVKPDRGLVKYVKIKKKRDSKLEKDFAALLVDQKKEIKKYISLKNAVQDTKEALDELKRIAHELTKRRKQNVIRITDAKDKLAVEDQRMTGAKTERERMVIKARQEIFARAQAKSELEVIDVETAIKETNDAIDQASKVLENKTLLFKDCDAVASVLLGKQTAMQLQAKQIADEDFTEITDAIEKLRKTEKYKQVVPVSQTDEEYIFMLVQPEEYVGDPVTVQISPADPTP